MCSSAGEERKEIEEVTPKYAEGVFDNDRYWRRLKNVVKDASGGVISWTISILTRGESGSESFLAGPFTNIHTK
ncbi:MAG: hypothetical protein ACLVB1_04230 [Blautia obeum]